MQGPGRERHLRPQGIEEPDRVARYRRRLWGADRDRAERSADHGVPVAQLDERAPVRANERAGLLQPVPGTHARASPAATRIAGPRMRATATRGSRGFSRPAPPGAIRTISINLTGRLDGNDRPHILNASGTYEIPKVAVQVSGKPDRSRPDGPTARSSRCGCRRGCETSSSSRRVRIAGRISSGCTCG